MISWLKCSTGSLPPSNTEVWCIVKISDYDDYIRPGCRRLITVGTFNPESGWWFRNAYLRPFPTCSANTPTIRQAESCEYWAPIDPSSRAILDKATWSDL